MFSLDRVRSVFRQGIARANGTIAVYRHIKEIAPAALPCGDLLRSAVVTASSAFDLLNHQAFRAALINRLAAQALFSPLTIPAHVLHLPLQDALPEIDAEVKRSIDHKSFLQPDKIAGLYAPLLSPFWESVATQGPLSCAEIKEKLRLLAVWRNRIVHESDVNPDLAGIGEWPIFVEDVESGIATYAAVGDQILRALSCVCLVDV